MKISYLKFKSMLGILGVVFSPLLVNANESPPNILFILADDMGFGDLGCYGNSEIKTPNLDGLAEQGAIWTHFYVNGPVCSPARAGFLTGQFPARHGLHGHLSVNPKLNTERDMPHWLDPNAPSIASVLRGNGYFTGHIGKWHLGNVPGSPEISRYGFDYVGMGADAIDPDDDPYFRARSTSLMVDESVEFLRQANGRPFYLQLWLWVPHALLNPTEHQMAPYDKWQPGGDLRFPHRSARQIYYGTLTDMDKHLGRLFKVLDEMGLAENTLIIFTADGGPEDIHIRNAGHSGIGNTGPFRGRKRSIYEGGIRMPLIARWSGQIPAGTVDTESVISGIDFLPTFAALAGTELSPDYLLDGENAKSVFQGDIFKRKKPLFWEWRFRVIGDPIHHSPQLGMRKGKWTFLMNPDSSRKELYDIKKDPMQVDNIAVSNPGIVENFSRELLDWKAELPGDYQDPEAGRVISVKPEAMKWAQ